MRKSGPEETARILFEVGADIVQLRHKNAPSYELVALAKKIRKIATRHKKAFLINDRVDVALASLAHGVHLGNGDISLRTAQQLLPKKRLFGRTIHRVADARKIGTRTFDYISVGPIFRTPQKRALGRRGTRFIRKIKSIASVPVFAIGGINARNVLSVLEHGADGVCVTRAAFSARSLIKKMYFYRTKMKNAMR